MAHSLASAQVSPSVGSGQPDDASCDEDRDHDDAREDAREQQQARGAGAEREHHRERPLALLVVVDEAGEG